jgi:SAM-dependent methyltransferase
MAPEHTDRPRPKRADVADGYDRGTDAYETLWSPVILPPAAALVRSLRLADRCVVADVGAGTGALLDVIGSAAPDARVVALDTSAGMLRLARTQASRVLRPAVGSPRSAGPGSGPRAPTPNGTRSSPRPACHEPRCAASTPG